MISVTTTQAFYHVAQSGHRKYINKQCGCVPSKLYKTEARLAYPYLKAEVALRKREKETHAFKKHCTLLAYLLRKTTL